ncbi:MAG: hypothetical protein ACFB0C_05760 [Leptolyngbyaceae cyanobacterium]
MALTLLVIPALYSRFGHWFILKPNWHSLEVALVDNGASPSEVINR